MVVQAFLLCDSVMRDGQTGKMIVSGIFDKVMATQFPAVHPKCSLYFRLRFDPSGELENRRIHLALIAPSGMRQVMPPVVINVPPNGVTDGNIDIMGLPLGEPGEHQIELYVENEKRSSYALTVVQIPAPSEGRGAKNADAN